MGDSDRLGASAPQSRTPGLLSAAWSSAAALWGRESAEQPGRLGADGRSRNQATADSIPTHTRHTRQRHQVTTRLPCHHVLAKPGGPLPRPRGLDLSQARGTVRRRGARGGGQRGPLGPESGCCPGSGGRASWGRAARRPEGTGPATPTGAARTVAPLVSVAVCPSAPPRPVSPLASSGSSAPHPGFCGLQAGVASPPDSVLIWGSRSPNPAARPTALLGEAGAPPGAPRKEGASSGSRGAACHRTVRCILFEMF